MIFGGFFWERLLFWGWVYGVWDVIVVVVVVWLERELFGRAGEDG